MDYEFLKLDPGYPLRPGYELWWMRTSAGYCGDGARMIVELRHNGLVRCAFETCTCGRGCGGSDCIIDDYGAHDTVLEEFRADLQKKVK